MGKRFGRADALAILAVVLYAVFIFSEHLFGKWNFIGASDRLETFLNYQIFALDSVRDLGRIPAWDDRAFMGFSLHALPWMLPGFDPVPWLLSLLPPADALYAFGIVSLFWYMLGGLAGYLYFRSECGDPVAAATAAILYISSYIAVLHIAQVDNDFLVFLLTPLGMLALKRMARGFTFGNVIGFVLTVTLLLAYGNQQLAAYALLLFGLYTLYLFRLHRRAALLWVPASAVALGILIAMPRLAMVAAAFAHTARAKSSFLTTTDAFEILRWFQDGMFGRTWEEAQYLNAINVHEGLQLFTSTFVPFFVLTWLAVQRDRSARAAGLLLYAAVLGALAVTFPAVWAPILLLLVWAAGMWGLRNWRWRAAGRFRLWAITRLPLWAMRCPPFPMTNNGAVGTIDFHAAVSGLLLAAILLTPVRAVVYVLFLEQDFLHGRLSGIASLTILALTACFLAQAAGGGSLLADFVRRHRLVSLGAALSALAFVVLRHFATGSVVVADALAQLLPHSPAILPSAMAVTLLSAVVYCAIVCLYCIWRGCPVRRQALVFALAALMVADAGSYVSFQLGGPPTRRYPFPFDQHNFMMAPDRAFRLPDKATLQAVHDRLQVDAYRSVYITDNRRSDTHPASLIAQFWRLRFVEGYAPGVPDDLADLPWYRDTLLPRSIRFTTLDQLNWRLLAFLNVKYAIRSNLPFYYDLDDLDGNAPFSADRLDLVENPHPVVPRAFFTRRIEPPHRATAADLAAHALVTPDGVALPVDPQAVSIVAGLPVPKDFAAAGSVTVASEGDRMRLTFAPAAVERFLVVDERYTPDWTAESRQGPLPVMATNQVMRGVMVPPGLDSITLVYRSLLYAPSFLALSALGVLGALALAGIASGRKFIPRRKA